MDRQYATRVTSHKRYEYDGLKLLRVDEKYDTGGGSIDANDPWRTLEAATYGPGIVGNLLAKRRLHPHQQRRHARRHERLLLRLRPHR